VPESTVALAHQFDDLSQQHEAGWLGMWIFLATEVMFFGGLFTGYAVYRSVHPEAFAHASRELDIGLGATNTLILICSSLTMALAVHAAQVGRRRHLVGYLLATLALGLTFLGIKGIEYAHKFQHHLVPGSAFVYAEPYGRTAQIFFSFYFAMTGMHALHMVIGVGLLAVLILRAWRDEFTPHHHAPVEITGLYWHFVDIVWIFLFPLLYLIERHR
jgi:cytochrome c oxidase subunit 3